MGNATSTHEPLGGGFQRAGIPADPNNVKNSVRASKRSPRKMDRLRRSFRDSFRRRKERVPESSKPHQWQADEASVRAATCTFSVKYLGCVEVFESRGMQVCEEALKVLRNSRRRAVRAILHVSGDGLRVVEDDTKGLIVDQTIEKVSFCAPDRNHERGFSYICRDGTTRRWMCHGFLAMKESGERLSHAVGCAFAACLERKQRRDKECGVTMTFDHKNNTFTRSGSFRQPGLTERLANERGIDIANSSQQPKPFNPFAIERPHATPTMLERQGSFRGFTQLNNSSPFKRQMSLRINDLPSNAERQRAFFDVAKTPSRPPVSPIPEVSPGDSVSAMCQELSQGLSLLTNSSSDDFNFNNRASINQNNNGWKVDPLSPPLSPPLPGDILATERSVTYISTSVTAPAPLTPTSNTSRASTNFSMTLTQNSVTPTSSRSRNSGVVAPPSPNPSITSFSTSLTHALSHKVPLDSPNLPNPDQWLGQVVNSTTPKGPSPATPRRTPSLNVHSRARSLSSADTYPRTTDPFDAEWASVVASRQLAEAAPAPPTTSTNPFIAPQSQMYQSVQL